ncbi:MAG: ABC transporter ATP-binding protein [Chlamydiales bacterium]
MQKSKIPILRLLSYLRPFKAQYIRASIYSISNKLFDILPEIIIGVAIDVVVHQKHSWLAQLGIQRIDTQLIFLGLLALVTWGFESFFEYLYSINWKNLAQSVQHALRLETTDHIQKIDQATFDQLRTGNLISILNDDVNQLERFLEDGVNQIIQILFSTFTIGLIFFILAPKIALFAILPIPLIIAGAFFFQNKLTPKFLAVRQKAGEIASRLTNALTGMLTIKSLIAEEFELQQIQQVSEEYRQANAKAIQLSSLVTPVIRVAILIGFLGTLVYGGLLTIEGKLSVGIYGMLVFLTQRLLWPLTMLAEVTINFQRTMAATFRVLDLLQIPISMVHGKRRLPKEKVRGSIAFRDIAFGYETQHPVFKDFSVEIPKGSTIAFVGTTGSGKSTLIKLLLRFYEPNQGSIELDGLSLREFDIHDLRRAIGLVSQDVFLFHGTVAENITYPDRDVPQERVIEAAKLAEAHDFITRLPQGYQTVIGERGLKLSGGQRQRLTIAREIIKNPPILILDEATSSVDNETELAIHQSLEKLIVGRTVIMVAHRLSTVRNADVIHVLKHGKIVESGSHDELLSQEKNYANLWKLQTGQPIAASIFNSYVIEKAKAKKDY